MIFNFFPRTMSPLQVSVAETEEGALCQYRKKKIFLIFILSIDFLFLGFPVLFRRFRKKKGDCAETEEGPLPQTAQVAAQQGAFVAHLLNDEINRAAPAPGHTADTMIAHRYSRKVRAL